MPALAQMIAIWVAPSHPASVPSPPPPPSLNLHPTLIQSALVRYSVDIKLRVIIHVSSERKLAVVHTTRVLYTIVYIVYKL